MTGAYFVDVYKRQEQTERVQPLFHIEQLLFRLKIIGIFLVQLGAKPPDAAVQVPFHQRLSLIHI